ACGEGSGGAGRGGGGEAEGGTGNGERGTEGRGRAARGGRQCSGFRFPRSALGGGVVGVVGVFGGGGAKSVACAGAWKALVEAGLTPSHLVGTSMGAVIAAAFASGATYDEVVIAGRSLSQRDVARVDPLALVRSEGRRVGRE